MRVAAIGDNCIDVYPRLGRQYPTGNAVDFAVNIRKLGFPTAVVSVTGSDDNGRWMLDTLKAEGIDISHLRVGNGATAITTMDMDGKDRVHGEYVEGVLADLVFTPEEVDFAARHDLVHTAFWGKAENNLAELKGRGALLSFDYSTKKDDPLVARTLPYVDYAFFSLKRTEAETYLKDAWKMGPKVVVGTFGADGSLAYDGELFYQFGIFPAQVENTVGAGDAFIAGFMAEVLHGHGLEEALRGGARVAAEVVEVFEPWVKK
ncbi:MAG TPA: fructoselysine 6-kinase [Anaerolineaceae bacterium]|jgi:fructoselysine 6-kinase|nr:fructoselysine 6-kinase [Anaerolineaceae bacterium]NMD26610.1 fructoselysine 6-kinase [Chloroflexota bacterium]HOA21769.1 fructoselysine 6-kinase [Anaerolineaceae bacterium]HOG77375.1 fructoselysine 6-kinase [Anaerolineaceae bacterium]